MTTTQKEELLAVLTEILATLDHSNSATEGQMTALKQIGGDVPYKIKCSLDAIDDLVGPRMLPAYEPEKSPWEEDEVRRKDEARGYINGLLSLLHAPIATL